MAPTLVTDTAQLTPLIDEWHSCERVAVDIEANGLHAYRASLCVLQVGWLRDDQPQVAVVDPLVVDVRPLEELLGDDGPIKVLHDLTFDARMLQECDIQLGNVRDTSVAARFLGAAATGLAALVQAHLGLELSKGLQDHNWAERPFTDDQLEYLAGDVRHLLALERALAAQAEALDIGEEVSVECAHKLRTALRPPRDQRPAHTRIKGYAKLDAEQQAIVYRLHAARETIAEAMDRPSFRIAPSGLLLEMARRKPAHVGAIRRMCGRQRIAGRHADAWRDAIVQGQRDGTPPADPSAVEPPPPPSREERAQRQALERALTSWRRAEAKQRGVDLQVVLPGHRNGPLTSALLSGDDATRRDAIAGLEGLGHGRRERYTDSWLELARRATQPAEDAPPD
jgi:ribonuclease D